MPPKPSKKRRADGRFRVYAAGKYFYSTVSYADAQRQAKEYRKEIEAGMQADLMRTTVRQYAAKWLPLHKAHVSDRTYNSYAALVNTLIDALGDCVCNDVTPDEAKAVFVNRFPPRGKNAPDGYSGSAIRKAKMLYIAIFDSAVENGICHRNPFRAKGAQPVIGEDGTHRQITYEERQLILESDHWMQPAVMAMLYAGLRRGEAIAVDIDRDVDPSGEWLSIGYAVRYDSNRPIIDDPKTKKGIRTIPIFAPLRPYLVGKHGLLVSSRTDGSVLTETAFTAGWASYCAEIERKLNGGVQRRWFGLTNAARAADPEKYLRIMRLRAYGRHEEAEQLRLEGWKPFTVRPHDLRHSFCTMLRDAGVDMKQAITWMGHADEKMILKIYDHPGAKRAADSIKKVENMLELGQ